MTMTSLRSIRSDVLMLHRFDRLKDSRELEELGDYDFREWDDEDERTTEGTVENDSNTV